MSPYYYNSLYEWGGILDDADLYPEVICEVNSNDVCFSSKLDEDHTIKIECVTNGSLNKSFAFIKYLLYDENTATEELFKYSADDICPIHFDGSFVGANHGYNNSFVITTKNQHNLSETNIGEACKDSRGEDYLLIQVQDSYSLVVVKPDVTNVRDAFMVLDKPKDSLTFNSEIYQIAECSLEQIYSSTNCVDVRIYDADGNEVISDGVYKDSNFCVVEKYNIWYPPSMFEHLMSNVGNNTNESICENNIKAYCCVENKYFFSERGSITIESSVEFKERCWFDFYGITQSSAMGDYYMIPNTIWDTIQCQGNDSIEIYEESWRDKNPPNRFYQFQNNSYDTGICIGYSEINDSYDCTIKSTGYAGNIWGATHKMYPQYYNESGYKDSGFRIKGIAFRIPIYKYDEDITCMGWYRDGNDIFVIIECQEDVDKFINLPKYMDGMDINVIESQGNISLSDRVENSRMRIEVSKYGSAVLKLT